MPMYVHTMPPTVGTVAFHGAANACRALTLKFSRRRMPSNGCVLLSEKGMARRCIYDEEGLIVTSKQGTRHGSGLLVFAALLIVVGVLLLLQNFHVLPEGVWRTIWRFWPVALLIIGVNIFLRDRPWVAGFIILLILLATVGAAIWLARRFPDSFVMALSLSSL